MELKDLLPAVLIIAATIVAVSFIAQTLGVMQVNIDTDSVTGEVTTFSTASAQSLFYDDLVAASDTLTCNAKTLSRTTDYTIDNSAGTILGTAYPRTMTIGNFTGLYNFQVYLSDTPRLKTGTLVVWNCSDDSQVFSASTDYTVFINNGTVWEKSTGTMENNTKVCYNATYGYAITGDSCSIAYTYNPDESGLTGQGITAMSSFGDWWTIIIVVLISVVVIGIVMKLKGRET